MIYTYFPDLLANLKNIIAYSTENPNALFVFVQETLPDWLEEPFSFIHSIVTTINFFGNTEQRHFLKEYVEYNPVDLDLEFENKTSLLAAVESKNLFAVYDLIQYGANLHFRTDGYSFVDKLFSMEISSLNSPDPVDRSWNLRLRTIIELTLFNAPELFFSISSVELPFVRLYKQKNYEFARFLLMQLNKNFDRLSQFEHASEFSTFRLVIAAFAKSFKKEVKDKEVIKQIAEPLFRLNARLTLQRLKLKFDPNFSMFGSGPFLSKNINDGKEEKHKHQQRLMLE